ncbi:type II and III secretion system protein family protein [Uliginosibacterium sp. IMCC34675]|uniref:Type II and III secretion system protein family protein n=2 Tax=Uliginosibacterium aquaticum TaxID=2731212 RepID=A0ABX2IK80_9RHOO|nr:type II and III secretion system protein family protein [Uliginosibacterium aquaticum]
MTSAVQAAPAKAAQGSSPCSRVEIGPVVRLPLGKSTLLKPPAPVVRLLLGNPQNTQAGRPAEKSKDEEDKNLSAARNAARSSVADVDVLLLSPTELFLLGKTVGSTNLVLQGRDGMCTMFDVVVGMDTTALNASFREFLPAESGLKVSSAGDSLVLSGMVSDAAVVDRVLDIAGAFVRSSSGGGTARPGSNERIINMLEVAAPQQVMLEVKVAEISKALLDQYGINFTRALVSADGSMMRFMTGLFGGSGLLYGQVAGATGATVGSGMVGSFTNGGTTTATTAPTGSASIGGSSVTVPMVAGQNTTVINADMQKQDGLVKILAEPTVMAISGQEGSFLAGGRIFIPVQTNNGGGGTAIALEEKEFGVSLKFTPTVLAGGRINLKVNPEVSELSSRGVTISSGGIGGNTILPSFTTRKAITTVQLRDGQSFAIGGLIKNNVSSSITAFPFLGELPIIGALFRSTSFQNDRTELVFVITPRLVKPLPADYVLPTDAYSEPTRYDMIMDGKLEGRQPSVPPAPPAAANPAPAQGGFEVK